MSPWKIQAVVQSRIRAGLRAVTIFLDDNSAWPMLAKMLDNAGHDVQLPKDVGLVGWVGSAFSLSTFNVERVPCPMSHEKLAPGRKGYPQTSIY
jgi:hypothetical protein